MENTIRMIDHRGTSRASSTPLIGNFFQQDLSESTKAKPSQVVSSSKIARYHIEIPPPQF